MYCYHLGHYLGGNAMLMRAATAAVAAQTPRCQSPRSGIDINSIAGSMELMGTRISYARNEEIFGEGEPAEYLYKVVSGSVRSCKILDDGRRQVTGFHMVGEVFGLEPDEEHQFSAEAVNDSVVLVVKRSAIIALAARKTVFRRYQSQPVGCGHRPSTLGHDSPRTSACS